MTARQLLMVVGLLLGCVALGAGLVSVGVWVASDSNSGAVAQLRRDQDWRTARLETQVAAQSDLLATQSALLATQSALLATQSDRIEDQDALLAAQSEELEYQSARIEAQDAQLATQSARIEDQDAQLAAQSALLGNAVLVFDHRECPPGWQRFEAGEGRFLMVANDAVESQVYGAVGGNAQITLTTDQLPAHSHPYRDMYFSEANGTVRVPRDFGLGARSDFDNRGLEIARTSDAAGEGQPVEILPPYIALTFCRLAGSGGVTDAGDDAGATDAGNESGATDVGNGDNATDDTNTTDDAATDPADSTAE